LLIVAGGSGTRFGASQAKQYLPLAGLPVLAWSVRTGLSHSDIAQVVVVHPSGDGAQIATILQAAGVNPADVLLCVGGATRTHSVRAGLAALLASGLEDQRQAPPSSILIHDAARPGLDHEVIDRLLAALEHSDAAVPVLEMADALWDADQTLLLGPVNRDGKVRVQTPQAAHAQELLDAYAALPYELAVADDAAVLHHAGARIATVPGGSHLAKLTYPNDFDYLERVLTMQTDSRPSLLPQVGTGFDAHRLIFGAPLVLCGVSIAHSHGLAGHSDADVGWHALCDAIYGALCEGDIGKAFPPSDPQWKGAASEVFLAHAGQRIKARGGRLAHCDVTLICEAPRIGPHREAMIAATARVLGVSPSRVSIKATTTEAMGFTGRGEGIAAMASATVLLPEQEEADGDVS
jgi:2-C-methyl-D-erythritol 4-phosphate cytidylyltransferase/2-C-methyl-D-erythritol 2,4-cyclodiphosphate synthase